MEFSVGDRFQIKTDRHNWMFREFKGIGKNGKPDWDIWGYWGTLEQLVKALPDHIMRRLEGADLDQYPGMEKDIGDLCGALRGQRAEVFRTMGWAE